MDDDFASPRATVCRTRRRCGGRTARQHGAESPCRAGMSSSLRGSRAIGMFVVLEGKVKLGQTSSDGREQVMAVLGPGEMFGELSLFDPGERTSTATAVTDCDPARVGTTRPASVADWTSGGRRGTAAGVGAAATSRQRSDGRPRFQ